MPTDEQRALWSAIRANPLDDTPRLVYADWLQEHGDEARAEFIRVQCALAKLGTDRRKHRKERPALEARQEKLLAAHYEWAAPFRMRLKGGKRWDPEDRWLRRPPFRRGFLDANNFELATARLLADAGDELEPVNNVQISDCQSNYNHDSVRAVCRWPGAGCVVWFSIAGADDRDITAITQSESLLNLSHIGLWYGNVTDFGIEELAAWPHGSRLRSLDLQDNAISDRGAVALADSLYLCNLTNLVLNQTRIGRSGFVRLRGRFGTALHI
jgi:uncharacterized protein (TIGR02996 family)